VKFAETFNRMGILWCETHLKSYNPLMEKIASFLRLVQFNSFDFFHVCCCKKKSKLQNCNKRMQTKSTCLWMKNAFQVGPKKTKSEAKKAWTKSTSLHSNQDCVSEKNWEKRASLNFCKWNWNKRMWGACMYTCFTLIDQWQAPGIW